MRYDVKIFTYKWLIFNINENAPKTGFFALCWRIPCYLLHLQKFDIEISLFVCRKNILRHFKNYPLKYKMYLAQLKDFCFIGLHTSKRISSAAEEGICFRFQNVFLVFVFFSVLHKSIDHCLTVECLIYSEFNFFYMNLVLVS